MSLDILSSTSENAPLNTAWKMFTKNYNLLIRDPKLSHLVYDFIVEPMEEVVEPEFAAG